jgi:hypothetical protein
LGIPIAADFNGPDAMIIKPVCRKAFVTVPNSLLDDTRLSIETRGMLAYLLSKPKNWNIRPFPLAKAISHGGKPLGRKRLDRMFREATEAGYMARSAAQGHKEDGSWDRYDYIIGMPEEVATALQKMIGATEPHSRQAYAPAACTLMDAEIQKEQNQKSNKDKKPLLQSLFSDGGEQAKGRPDEQKGYGEAAHTADWVFVWERSEPFNKWKRYRRANGEEPLPVVEQIIRGKVLRGVWLPTLYPPEFSAGTARMPAIDTKEVDSVLAMIMTSRECSREEAAKIFASLPDGKSAAVE